MAFWGLVPEAPAGVDSQPVDAVREFPLWPENAETWRLFLQVATQWRHGFNGPTGLDYCAVLAHLRDGAKLQRRKVQGIYSGILAIERGALTGWAEKREELNRD